MLPGKGKVNLALVELVVSLARTGVDDNETMKVFRSGGADPDGNQPGDLYITIKVTLIFHSFVPSFNSYIVWSISLADVMTLLFIGKKKGS